MSQGKTLKLTILRAQELSTLIGTGVFLDIAQEGSFRNLSSANRLRDQLKPDSPAVTQWSMLNKAIHRMIKDHLEKIRRKPVSDQDVQTWLKHNKVDRYQDIFGKRWLHEQTR